MKATREAVKKVHDIFARARERIRELRRERLAIVERFQRAADAKKAAEIKRSLE